eukprot:1330514-Amorphochlora_amoeboformis.AAC.1
MLHREVAVLQGSGYWYQKDVLNYVAKASKILDESDVKYNSSTYTFAGYDPPFRLFGRHNEVWIDLISSEADIYSISLSQCLPLYGV